MSNNNKIKKDYYFNQKPSFAEEKVDSINESPVVEVKEEVKKDNPIKAKKYAKVILITKDGCIAQESNGNNISFYGKDFMNKSIGDEIEF